MISIGSCFINNSEMATTIVSLLRPRVLSLAYCFFSSSVVSFGFYFAIDSLSGNRFANMAAAGSGKVYGSLLIFRL